MADNNGLPSERLIKFEVFGQQYAFHTAAPEEEVAEILQMVRNQLEKVAPTASARILSDKMAILTCLNMASEMVRLKRELNSLKKAAGENICALTKRIESYL